VRARRLAVRVHRWSGLITAPLFLVLGLSGAVLVFREELEDAVSGPPVVARPLTATSLDAVVRAALLPHPATQAHALRVPARADRPYRVELYHGERRLDVAVDASTFRVVGSRAPERSVFAAVHALHAAFHAGRAGTIAVGLLGAWLVVESITGLWLYGASVRLRAGAGTPARSRTLHRVVGAASLGVGVVIGLTGALLALASALALADAPRPAPRDGLAALDVLVGRVQVAVPGARVVTMVAEPDRTVRVDVRMASGSGASVHMDRDTGEIVAPRASAPGGLELIRRFHAGDFAGALSRTIYVVAGLALPLLSITGLLIAAGRGARTQSSNVLT
jgi:uncharacterized iron-regulated membrane protein